MAITPHALQVETALDLETALNAELASLTSELIFDVEIDQVQSGPYYSKNLYAAFTSAPSSLIASPFQFKVFTQPTIAAALIKVKQFIAANPAYFFSGIYVVYRPQNPDPNEGIIMGIFYNIAGAVAAGGNWGGTTTATGAVGGDLSGSLPNPIVVGIENVPINGPPIIGGSVPTYNALTNRIEWYVVLVYPSLAAAVLGQANQISGQNIVVPTGPQAGTYQVIALTGNITDYMLISTTVSLASQIGLDAPIVGLNAADVFVALQILTGVVAGAVAPTATTDLASVAIANFCSVIWEFTIQRGTVRYSGTVQAQHDGAVASWTVFGPVVPAAPFDVTVQAVVAAGNLTLQAVNAGAAATFRVRTRGLPI